MLEHQVVAVGGEQLDVGVAHRGEHVGVRRCGGRVELVGGACEGLRDALEAALDRGEEQLALAAEQAEHVRLRDADLPGDPVDGGAVQAAVRELVDRRLDQRVPALGGRDALTGCDWCGSGVVAMAICSILRDA